MRILVFGAPFLNSGFKALGCELINVGDKQECDVCYSHPLSALKVLERARACGFEPDLCLYCDSGNMPQFFDLEKLPCPSAFYSIDSYCNPWHIPFGHAFDKVFVAQKDYVDFFVQGGIQAIWLPLFYKAEHQHYLAATRDIPVSFVGTPNPRNNPDRQPFLQSFRKLHPLFVGSGAYIPLFGRSLIVLNQTAALEINFRCFEAMACGAALLMEECGNGLRDLFIPGHNILPSYTRGCAQQAADIAAAALRNPQGLARIAEEGRKLVESLHGNTQRASFIIKELCQPGQSKAAEKRLGHCTAKRNILLSNAYFFLAAELHEKRHAPHRELYLRLAQMLAARAA